MKKMTFALVCALAVVSLAGCKKKKGGAGAAESLAKMSEFKDEMCKCKDAKCAQDVNDRMNAWSQEQRKNDKEGPKLNDDQKKQAQQIGDEMGKCLQTALGAAPAGSGSAAPVASGELPAECVEYKAAVDKLATCDKVPEAARAALKKAYDDQSAGWANMQPEAKAGLPTACKAGTEAVMSAAKVPCGW